MSDIPANQWSDAWRQESVTNEQTAVMARDLASWKAGQPHYSFDAYRTLLQRLQRPPKRILECGCGAGCYYEVTRMISARIKYTGCDIAGNQITRARQLYPDGNFVVADCNAMPFADSSYDIVCLAGLISNIPDYRMAIREGRRVTSKWLMLHRVIANERADRAYIHQAYGTQIPERELCELTLLEFCHGSGLEMIDSMHWDRNEHGQVNASYVFNKVTKK